MAVSTNAQSSTAAPSTLVEGASRLEIQNLVSGLLRRWEGLTWRRHGLGVMQAYLREGDTDELRVHVWHPSLVADCAGFSGAYHDHRFDMISTVLIGSVPHEEVFLTSGDCMQMFSVVNARNAEQIGDPFELLGHTGIETRSHRIDAGQRYHFPRRAFHRSAPITDLAVTVVQKKHQQKDYARILVPRGETPVHLTRAGLPKPSREPAAVLDEARQHLTDTA